MAKLYRMDGWVKGTLGNAIAGAQVYVCYQPANTTFVPPDPLVSIYSDVNGLVPINHCVTDGFGHYFFYALSGFYTVVVVNGGNTQQVYLDQMVGLPGTGL
jgi:hypothetical protein